MFKSTLPLRVSAFRGVPTCRVCCVHLQAARQLSKLAASRPQGRLSMQWTRSVSDISTATKLPPSTSNDVLPHRRRKAVSAASPTPPTRTQNQPPPADPVIPPDASAQLSAVSSKLPSRSLRRLFTTYLALSKPRLSFLVVLTAAAAYSIYPVPAVLHPSATALPSISAVTLFFLTSGTFLSSASANTLNMIMEPKYDAQMSRTRNRPLVRKLITPRSALLFAIATGVSGLGALYYGVNPTVAGLSALNIFLYAGVYTPMKRISVLNTWIGAVVGAIPPLMGWTAAAGQVATTGDWRELLLGPNSAGGWILAALLFAWQFPHFNALSWTIREEYKAAGYRMLCWTNPAMNARVALRYSVLFFPICAGLYYSGVVDGGFLVTSSVANSWLLVNAYKFYRDQGHKGSARGLFWAGVWQLPLLMVLAMVHKRGLWDGVYRWVEGENSDEEVDI